jgi:DNA polymerase alpha subunit B N-terminal
MFLLSKMQHTNLPHSSFLFSQKTTGTGVGMAASLNVSAKQMAECWEAFSLNRNVQALDTHCFDAFKKQLVKEADQLGVPMPMDTDSGSSNGAILSRPSPKAASSSTARLPSVTPPANKRLVNEHNDNMDSSFKNRRITLSPSPPTRKDANNNNSHVQKQQPKYNERTGAGKVMQTFNPSNLEAAAVESTSSRNGGPKCRISYDGFDTNVKSSYRHMNTPLEERAVALDQHLVDLGQAMVERYGLAGKEVNDGEDEQAGGDTSTETAGIASLEAVGVARQEKVCCLGRICNAVRKMLEIKLVCFFRLCLFLYGTLTSNPVLLLHLTHSLDTYNRLTKVD